MASSSKTSAGIRRMVHQPTPLSGGQCRCGGLRWCRRAVMVSALGVSWHSCTNRSASNSMEGAFCRWKPSPYKKRYIVQPCGSGDACSPTMACRLGLQLLVDAGHAGKGKPAITGLWRWGHTPYRPVWSAACPGYGGARLRPSGAGCRFAGLNTPRAASSSASVTGIAGQVLGLRSEGFSWRCLRVSFF